MRVADSFSGCCCLFARPPLAHLIALGKISHGLPPGSCITIFCIEVLQQSIVQHSLGEKLLEPGVLVLQRLSLRASDTSMPPNFAFHLEKTVACADPAVWGICSSSKPRPPVAVKLRIICSSENLLFLSSKSFSGCWILTHFWISLRRPFRSGPRKLIQK